MGWHMSYTKPEKSHTNSGRKRPKLPESAPAPTQSDEEVDGPDSFIPGAAKMKKVDGQMRHKLQSEPQPNPQPSQSDDAESESEIDENAGGNGISEEETSEEEDVSEED